MACLLAGDPAGDHLAGVLSRLERDRAELRQDLLGLRVHDRGHFAEVLLAHRLDAVELDIAARRGRRL